MVLRKLSLLTLVIPPQGRDPLPWSAVRRDTPEGPEEPLSWLLLKRENHQLRKTPTYVCNIILINPRHQDGYVHPKDNGDSQVPRWDREKGRVTACLPATGLASKPAVWKQTQRHHLCYAKQRCPVLAGYSSPKVFWFLFFSNVTVI